MKITCEGKKIIIDGKGEIIIARHDGPAMRLDSDTLDSDLVFTNLTWYFYRGSLRMRLYTIWKVLRFMLTGRIQ